MQFKMAENSLFAMLMRSPWWYSLALAMAMVALVAAAFGQKYLIFGIAGAIPFFGIAGLAAYRQWQVPGAKEIEKTVETASAMSAREFTTQIGQAYERQDYEVKPFAGDAADLELTKGWRVILVSTKRFKAARQGVEPLKALKKTGRAHEATGLIYVSLGAVTDTAKKFAVDNNIELLDASAIAQLLAGKRS